MVGKVILPHGAYLAISRDIFIVTTGGRERCYWHLAGRD